MFSSTSSTVLFQPIKDCRCPVQVKPKHLGCNQTVDSGNSDNVLIRTGSIRLSSLPDQEIVVTPPLLHSSSVSTATAANSDSSDQVQACGDARSAFQVVGGLRSDIDNGIRNCSPTSMLAPRPHHLKNLACSFESSSSMDSLLTPKVSSASWMLHKTSLSTRSQIPDRSLSEQERSSCADNLRSQPRHITYLGDDLCWMHDDGDCQSPSGVASITNTRLFLSNFDEDEESTCSGTSSDEYEAELCERNHHTPFCRSIPKTTLKMKRSTPFFLM